MKTSARTFLLSAAVALSCTLTLAALAQDNNKQPDPASAQPAPEPAAQTPPPTAPKDQPAAPPAAAPAPAAATPASAPAAEPKVETPAPPKLRRLDDPNAPVDSKSWHRTLRTHHHSTGNEVVHVGGDAMLEKGQTADAVVAVFGSATSDGEVSDSVVSIFGNTKVNGPVGDSAVAVGGNVKVNSKVADAVVAVFGNVELGPDAEVGDVVAVGGRVTRDPHAVVHGQVQNVTFIGALSDLGWLQNWITNCLLFFRPLAFAPGLMWAWWIAIGFLMFYALVALLFPRGVNKCVETLEQRPGYSILTALLTVLCAPIVTVLLAITGVGIAVIPFLAVGLFVASLFGKVVMLAWLGRKLAKLVGSDLPALAVLLGGIVLMLLYTVPVLGFILYKLTGWIGLGVVVYVLLQGMKREKTPVIPVPINPVTPAGDGSATPPPLGVPVAGAAVTAVPVFAVATLPRAGFWIRMAALLLDVILVGLLCSMLNGIFTFGSHVHIRSDLLPALAVYGAVMWKLKGSTVGGIVCGLKVVRLDDREIDWGTAIVRALGCFLSLVVLGLGFLWVVFDDQRQSWHDKIAGTTVVRVPKGVSLV